MSGNVEWDNVELMIFLCFAGMLLFIILQIILYVLLRQFLYPRKELERLNDMNGDFTKQQKKYYEEIDRKSAELREFRHDFYEYIEVLNDLANREDLERLKSYLESMTEKKISVFYINVGNPVANVVINKYYEKAAESGIEFSCIGNWEWKEPLLTDMEFCCVLSNLLKNAVEAAQKVQCGIEKKIIVEMRRDKEIYQISVENTANPPIERDGRLITWKKDKENHGLGLKNVRKIVEKYDGKMEWGSKNQKFWIEVSFRELGKRPLNDKKDHLIQRGL